MTIRDLALFRAFMAGGKRKFSLETERDKDKSTCKSRKIHSFFNATSHSTESAPITTNPTQYEETRLDISIEHNSSDSLEDFGSLTTTSATATNVVTSTEEECSTSAPIEVLSDECCSHDTTGDDINDVGLITAGHASALPQNTIAKLLKEKVPLPSPTPVHRYTIGGKIVQAYFQTHWLNEYSWLVWSPSQSGAYCKYCVLFAKQPQGKCHGGGQLGKLVLTPFKDFKNAKGKKGVLDKHEKCQYHIDAVLTGKAFLLQCDKPNIRIDSILDSRSQELAASNKLALKSIVECILYCGRQGISFHGHRDDATASPNCNKGSLIEFRALTDPVLRTFLDNAPRNARYTSKTIQNELIEICGNYVREVMNSAVYNSGYFAVIADEVTDSSNNHSVLGVCNRMLDTGDPNNPVIKETFFDFVQLERTNSETVCTKLVECYTSRNIDLNKVCAQTYDTTSSMSSSLNGVQGRF